MDFIFGPVPSRRLGRSLGVDLVPFKTCTYDCIYCQLGRTTNRTVERKEYVPLNDVLDQLCEKLAAGPDYITLSGSGEPTLYSRLDELIDGIRSRTNVPVAVLTNGSLLWQPEVRRQLLGAHVVIPSLDAGDSMMFKAVNRPHENISFEKVLDGLIAFRREYKGDYILEVFLLAGHTAIESEVRKIADCAGRINPDRVQLNTVLRPPAEEYAFKVKKGRMEELAGFFVPPAEVIADFKGRSRYNTSCSGEQAVMELVRRRPCSLEDVAQGLAIHRQEAQKFLEQLRIKGLIESHSSGGTVFYRSAARAKHAG